MLELVRYQVLDGSECESSDVEFQGFHLLKVYRLNVVVFRVQQVVEKI